MARLIAARTVSSLGDGIVYAAIPLLLARITHSPLALAGVEAAYSGAWLVLALWAGHLADRRSRVGLMAAGELGQFVVMTAVAALVVTGSPPVPAILALFFLAGAGEVVHTVASSAVLPALAGDRPLERPMGWYEAGHTFGNDLLGPGLGGVLLVTAPWAPFAVNAVSFLGSALLIVGLRHAVPARQAALAPAPRWSGLMEGVRYVTDHRPLCRLWRMTAAAAFTAVAAEATLVLFVVRHGGHSEGRYALLLMVGGVGALVGGMGCDAWARVLRRAGLPVALAATGAAAVAVWAAGPGSFVVLALGFVALHAVMTIRSVLLGAERQRLCVDAVRGRVASVFRLGSAAAAGVGALFGGALAQLAGLGAPLLAFGIGHAGLALWASRPAVRVPRALPSPAARARGATFGR